MSEIITKQYYINTSQYTTQYINYTTTIYVTST